MSSQLLYLHLLISLAVAQLVGAQQQVTGVRESQAANFDRALMSLLANDNANSGRSNKQDAADSQGERVDKLARVMGDIYWRNQQPDWLLYQQAVASAPNLRMQRSLAMSEPDFPADERAAYAVDASQLAGLDGPGSGPRNYHALVDEFKQYSRLANPSRESRAFKPKLMSTARGFGKRSGRPDQANELYPANSKSGAAMSSRHTDWISQVVSRWPWLDKYINDKYQDYNGNVGPERSRTRLPLKSPHLRLHRGEPR